MVELELKAVKCTIYKYRLYLLGLNQFTLIVDHQPLVVLLDRYTLDAVQNPRLQRKKERISQFIFNTVWRKGSKHAIPDAMSRAPVVDPSGEDIAEAKDSPSSNTHTVSCSVHIFLGRFGL